jgi:hypothetical protein
MYGGRKVFILYLSLSCHFEFTVKNIGPVPINLIYVSFKEQSEAPNVQDESPAHVYETLIYEKGINICWVQHSGEIQHQAKLDDYPPVGILEPFCDRGELLPNQERIFKIGVFGKKYSNGVSIQLQYGHIHNASNIFYSRDLTFSILITVESPITLRNMDFLDYTGLNDSLVSTTTLKEHVVDCVDLLEPRLSNAVCPDIDTHQASDYFLLTFDVENSSKEPFKVTFQIYYGIYKFYYR